MGEHNMSEVDLSVLEGGAVPVADEVCKEAVAHTLELTAEQQEEMKQMGEAMKLAEEDIKASMCGLSMIASVRVEAMHVMADDTIEAPRYIGALTMIGQNGEIFGKSIEGPEVCDGEEALERIKSGKSVDAREQLVAMLIEMAKTIRADIEEHP
jgi:hypothetical protein